MWNKCLNEKSLTKRYNILLYYVPYNQNENNVKWYPQPQCYYQEYLFNVSKPYRNRILVINNK